MVKDYYGSVSASPATEMVPKRESAIDQALGSLELEQKRLAETIGRLNDRLSPVLHAAEPDKGREQPGRPRMSAPLAEAITTQAECLARQVNLLCEIADRIAL